MSITKKSINNNEYEFVNSCRGNRSGFIHETKLYKNGSLIGEHKIQYYNRTWESYQYESVMKGLVNILLCSEFDRFKARWKQQNNVKRLTKQKEDAMYKDLAKNTPALYEDLQHLYHSLHHHLH